MTRYDIPCDGRQSSDINIYYLSRYIEREKQRGRGLLERNLHCSLLWSVTNCCYCQYGVRHSSVTKAMFYSFYICAYLSIHMTKNKCENALKQVAFENFVV